MEPHLRFGPARLWSRVWRWFREHMGHVEKALVVPVFSEARRPAYILGDLELRVSGAFEYDLSRLP